MEPSDTRKKLREMFKNVSKRKHEFDHIKTASAAEAELGEALLTSGSPETPHKIAAEEMSYRICKSMAEGTCVKCGDKYHGPWPLLGEEKAIDGWKSCHDGDDDSGTHLLLICPDCLPKNGKNGTWLQVLHKEEPEKENKQKEVTCSIANLHMDDVDFDVRKKMIEDIKRQCGADKVNLMFSLDCAENTSHYQSGVYFNMVGQRAINEARCIGCGEISPEPLGKKPGPFGKRQKFAMMYVAGINGLVPICHECFTGDGMYGMKHDLRRASEGNQFFGTVNIPRSGYLNDIKRRVLGEEYKEDDGTSDDSD